MKKPYNSVNTYLPKKINNVAVAILKFLSTALFAVVQSIPAKPFFVNFRTNET